MQGPDLLTKKEVAERLRVSIATIDRLMSSGGLKYVKLEKKVLFRKTDIEAFLKKHLVEKYPIIIQRPSISFLNCSAIAAMSSRRTAET
jgi:excisionase family DNA binding protein